MPLLMKQILNKLKDIDVKVATLPNGYRPNMQISISSVNTGGYTPVATSCILNTNGELTCNSTDINGLLLINATYKV